MAFALTSLVFVVLCIGAYEEQSMRLRTRTVSGRQFTMSGPSYHTSLATFREFEMRHGLNPEVPSGLRFSIHQSPAWEYLVSIQTLADGATKVAIAATPYGSDHPSYEREVLLDKYKSRLFFDTFDKRADGFWGSTGGCVDGTSFQFERWRNRKVIGANGNAACQRHYAELMGLLAETLAFELPDVPFDWHSWFTAKRYLELSEQGR
jgi:hypothetical protein